MVMRSGCGIWREIVRRDLCCRGFGSRAGLHSRWSASLCDQTQEAGVPQAGHCQINKAVDDVKVGDSDGQSGNPA